MMIDTYEELPALWSNQRDVIPELSRGSYSLIWEVRAGKTRPPCEALRYMEALGEVDAVIILPPVNAKDMWGYWLDVTMPQWQQFVCNGLYSCQIPPEYQVVICNPDILATQVRHAQRYRGWLGNILEWMRHKKVVLIEDEAHMYFLQSKTDRAQACAQIRRLVECVWQLSGTPMEKSGLDMHHLLKHLGPQRYPFFWWSDDQFGQRFCNGTRTWEGKQRGYRWKWGSFKDDILPAFLYSIRGCADRRLRSSIPELMDTERTLHLAEFMGEYRQDLTPSQWIADRRELIEMKVSLTVDKVRQLMNEGESPIVVWGWHRTFVQMVARELHAPNILGGTAANTRARLYNDFQEGKIPILCCNAKAAGVAMDLSRAHISVMGETIWEANVLRQCAGREEGVNQSQRPIMYHVLVRHSVDQVVWDRVHAKGRAIDKLDEAAERLRQATHGIAMAELEDVD